MALLLILDVEVDDVAWVMNLEFLFHKYLYIYLYFLGSRNRLEEVISADEIRGLKQRAMSDFELRIWNAFGCRFIKQEDRQMVLILFYVLL